MRVMVLGGFAAREARGEKTKPERSAEVLFLNKTCFRRRDFFSRLGVRTENNTPCLATPELHTVLKLLSVCPCVRALVWHIFSPIEKPFGDRFRCGKVHSVSFATSSSSCTRCFLVSCPRRRVRRPFVLFSRSPISTFSPITTRIGDGLGKGKVLKPRCN